MTSQESVTCAGCGAQEPAQPLTWSRQTGRGAELLLCEGCTRANVRSIEAKLEPEYW